MEAMRQLAIKHIRAGRTKTGRRYLVESLLSDPKDAEAWLWLSYVVDTPEQRQYCLERVSVLKPRSSITSAELGNQSHDLGLAGSGNSNPAGQHHLSDPTEEKKSSQFKDRVRKTSNDDREAFHRTSSSIERETVIEHSKSKISDGKLIVAVEDTEGTSKHSKGNSEINVNVSPECKPQEYANKGENSMKIKSIIISALFILIASVGVWYWQSEAQASSTASTTDATGTIEARKVSLAPEIGGLILEVMVDEGQHVSAGQPLVKLDGAFLETQRDQALAGLRAAQANLELLEAGATKDQIIAAESQLARAEANLKMIEATLDYLTAGSTPEEIAVLRTNLDRAWENYQAIKGKFSSEQLDAVREALDTASANLNAAKAWHEDLEKEEYNPAFVIATANSTITDSQAALSAARDTYEAVRDENLPYYIQLEMAHISLGIAESNVVKAEARHNALKEDERSTIEGLQAAETAHRLAAEFVDAAETAYDAVTSGFSAPLLKAAWAEVEKAQKKLGALAISPEIVAGNGLSVETLLAQRDEARAMRDMAAANLTELKNGARPEQIDAAQAQVDVAQAQVDALDIQLSKMVIYSPWDGIVLNRSVETGETVLPGTKLVEIGQLDKLELTIYIEETRLGLLDLGQRVMVRVDAYPNRVFEGTVLRVADEAEFTPSNIQLKDDRAKLVFALTIRLENSDLALKPGMIADVEFGG